MFLYKVTMEGKDRRLRCFTKALVFLQIKEKLLQLTEKRKEMIDKWEDRWEWLRLSKDTHFTYLSALLGYLWKACNFLCFFFFDVILLLNDFKVLNVLSICYCSLASGGE